MKNFIKLIVVGIMFVPSVLFAQNLSKEDQETINMLKRVNPEFAIEFQRHLIFESNRESNTFQGYEKIKFDSQATKDVLDIYALKTNNKPKMKLRRVSDVQVKIMDFNNDGVNEILFKNSSYSACSTGECRMMLLQADIENQNWETIFEGSAYNIYYDSGNQEENTFSDFILSTRNNENNYIYSYKKDLQRYAFSEKNFSEKVDFRSLSNMDKESEQYKDTIKILRRDFGERYLVIENSDPEFKSILVGKGDLNKDDGLETFLYFRNSVFCKNGTCKLFVYDKINAQPSFSFDFSIGSLFIGKRKRSSLSDIVLYEKNTYSIYEWNNSDLQYQLEKKIEE
jgi:hypothetical protein